MEYPEFPRHGFLERKAGLDVKAPVVRTYPSDVLETGGATYHFSESGVDVAYERRQQQRAYERTHYHPEARRNILAQYERAASDAVGDPFIPSSVDPYRGAVTGYSRHGLEKSFINPSGFNGARETYASDVIGRYPL